MALFKGKYRIESARLPGWDYSSPGYYFLSVCTHDRGCLFGHIADNKMCLNEFGAIVRDEWEKSFVIRHELLRDEFVVMPNHFHGIVRLVDRGVPVGTGANAGVVVETSGRTSLRNQRASARNQRTTVQNQRPVPEPAKRQPNQQTPRIPPKSVSSFMAGVKSVITRRINEIRNTPGAHVLQYRFHDHIIRDEPELFRIRLYIKNNPLNWNGDTMNCG